MHTRTSVTVGAPPERVWELLCDTTRYADWVVGTDAVTRTDGPARLGSTYDESNTLLGPWKGKSRWTVTEFEPPRCQRHEGEGLPLAKSFEIVMEVSPRGSGSELVLEARAEPSGPFGGLAAKAMQPQVKKTQRQTLDNFKALADREL